MSASQNTKAVDERIVEMKFDNAQFEQGVRQSTESLNRFKKAINTDGAEKAFDGIEKAANKVRLSGLNDAIEESGRHFSALQVVGISALATIASKATQVGIQMVKALSLNPILDGFREYETEMNSIKTIHANLPDTSFQQIKDTLQELNEYADLTIYSFGDMTRAIGYFTAAGVQVDAAARAIKGLSNIAAGAGANNQALARAEYQVSQALQGGVIHLMDWNSLLQAGMASPEFQQRLIENARAMGKNVDAAIAANGSFRESLKEDWLTTDVFLKTMDQAADATTEWGKRLTDAATVVNTFSQLTGTVAEAIGTGWGETMKLILGDAEESTELFTSIYKAIDPLISSYTKFRNDQVRIWAEMGGRKAIIDGLSHAFEALKNVLSPLTDIFRRVFGNAGTVMAELSARFESFTARVEEMTRPMRDFFKPITDMAGGAKEALDDVGESVERLTELANEVINGDWGNGQERIDRLREAGVSVETLQNRVNELLGCETVYADTQEDVNDVVAEGSEAITDMGNSTNEATRKQRAFTIAAQNYNNVLSGFKDALEIGKKALDIFLHTAKRVAEVLGRIVVSVGKIVLAIAGGFGRVITAINNVLERLGVVGKAKERIDKAFDKLDDPLTAFDKFADDAVDKIAHAFDWLADRIEHAEEVLEKIAPVTRTVSEGFKSAARHIGDFVGGLHPIQAMTDAFKGLQRQAKSPTQMKVSSGIDGVFKSYLDSFTTDDLVGDISKKFDRTPVRGITASVSDFCARVKSAMSVGVKTNTADLTSPFRRIKAIIQGGIRGIGITIGTLLDSINTNSIKRGAINLGKAIGGIIGMIPEIIAGSLTNLGKALGIISLGIKGFFAGFIQGLSSVGSGLGDVFKALWIVVYKIADVLKAIFLNPTTGVALIIYMIYRHVSIFGSLADKTLGQVIQLNRSIKNLADGVNNIGKGVKWVGLAAFFLGFSQAIRTLVECVDVLQTISPENIAKGIVAIIFLGAFLGAVTYFLTKYTDLKTTMDELLSGEDPFTQLANVFISLKTTISVFARAAMFASIAVILFSLAAGVYVLTQAIDALAKMDDGKLIEGGKRVAMLLGGLTAALWVLSKAGKDMAKSGAGILIISASILLLTKAIKEWNELLGSENFNIGSVAAIFGIFLAMTGLIALLNKISAEAGGGVLKNALSVLVLTEAVKIAVGAIKELATSFAENSDTTLASVGLIALLIIAFGGVLAALTYVSGQFGKGGGGAFASAVGMALIMFALKGLLEIIMIMPDPNKCIPVVGMIIAVIAVIGVALILINSKCSLPMTVAAAAAIGGIMVCMALMIAALSLLDGQHLDQYVPIIGAMIGVLVVIGVMIGILVGVIAGTAGAAIPVVAIIIALFAVIALMFVAIGWCAAQIGEGVQKVTDGVERLSVCLERINTLDDKAPQKLLDILGKLALGTAEVGISNIFNGAEAMEKLAPPIGYLSFTLEKWNNVDPSVGDRIKSVLQGIGGGIGALNFGGWGADAIAACAEGIGYLGEHVGSWNSVNPDVGKNIAWTLENAASGLRALNGSVAGSESINVSAGAISYLGEHIRAWESVNPDLGKSISETLKGIAGSINAFNGTADGATQIGYAASNLDKLSSSIERYSEVAPNFDGAKESQDGFTNSLSNFNVTSPLTEEKLEELASTTGMTSDEIRQQLEATGIKFSDYLPENIEEGATEGHENLEGKIPDYQGAFEKYKQTVEDAGNKMAEKGAEGGNATGTNLIKGIENQYPGAKSAGQGLGDKATEGLQNSTNHTNNLGKMFTDGFFNGIMGGQNDVIKAVAGFGTNVIDALAHVLGIRSPSREASYLGVMWNQGFKQGILKSSGDVTSSIEAVGLGVIQQVSKMNKSNEFTPKVSPVVDWSNYQNGSKQIQSTLNGISGNTNISQSIAYSRDQNILKELVEVKKDLKKYNDNLANLRPNVIIDGDVRSGVTQQFVDQRITDWANDMVQGGRSY